MENTDEYNDTDVEFDEYEFITSCFGRNELGEANVEISCSLLEFKGKSKEDAENDIMYNEISTRLTKNADFHLLTLEQSVRIDLKFRTNVDPELTLFWNCMEQYGERLSRYIMADECSDYSMPLLVFNVVPDAYADQYYMSLNNPVMWMLQPAEPGDSCLRILRLFFPVDNLCIHKLPQEADIATAEAEISRTYNVIMQEKEQR